MRCVRQHRVIVDTAFAADEVARVVRARGHRSGLRPERELHRSPNIRVVLDRRDRLVATVDARHVEARAVVTLNMQGEKIVVRATIAFADDWRIARSARATPSAHC